MAERSTQPGRRDFPALAICAVALVGAVLLLGWRLQTARRRLSLEPPGVNPIALQQALGANTRDRYDLVVIFTPEDCTACLPGLQEARSMPQYLPNWGVVGIMGYANSAEVRQAQSALDLGFPVVADPAGSLLRHLAPPTTPWRVLLDRQTGRILWQAPATFRPPDAKALASELMLFVPH